MKPKSVAEAAAEIRATVEPVDQQVLAACRAAFGTPTSPRGVPEFHYKCFKISLIDYSNETNWVLEVSMPGNNLVWNAAYHDSSEETLKAIKRLKPVLNEFAAARETALAGLEGYREAYAKLAGEMAFPGRDTVFPDVNRLLRVVHL